MTRVISDLQAFVHSLCDRARRLTSAQRIEVVAVAGIAVLSALLYLWALSRNGMGNSYYAAAVKSATLSWKAFLFGSLDPGSFITVDKPPFAFWIQALSCRVFGFSSWSMLAPQALAGLATVLILYRMVRRWIGRNAAVLAALTMALTPVAVVMFRFNNPDALLTFLLVASAWALWSAMERGSTWKLVMVGALVGLAFTTKMLEAIVVLPVFAVVYIAFGRRSVVRRLLQLAAGGAAAAVAASWWVLAVMLWPAASRPFIGGSSDNSALGLAFSRTAGYFSSGSSGPGLPGGPSFSGSSGWLRMFNAQLGNQISWLLPLALFGLAAGLWVYRSRPRTDLQRAGFILWGLWTLLFTAVFSDAQGVLHPYYTVVLAPSVAALVGGGSVALWKLSSGKRWLAWLMPAGIVGSVAWSASLLGRTPDYAPGLVRAILVVGVLAAAGLGLVLARVVPGRVARYGFVVVACACLLAGPFAYAVTTISRAVSGPFAAAGPVSAAAGDLGLPRAPVASKGLPPALLGGPRGMVGIGEDLTVDDGLISYLKAHRGTAEYLVAVQGATSAVPIILATGQPVIAMGGFSGSDPAPTLAQLQSMVAAGRIRYILISGGGGMGGPPGMGGFGGPGGGSGSELAQWAAANGTVVPSSEYGGTAAGTLYYFSAGRA